MTKRSAWVVVAPLLGVVACADVWGFDDLTLGQDGGSPDATTPGDDQSVGSEGGGDSETDAGSPGSDSGGDAADAQPARDGGDAGSIREGGGGDGGNDAAAAIAYCATHCPMGCCDVDGQCIAKPATTTCGIGGQACVNCGVTQTTCTFATPACCNTSSGKCGCTALGLCTTN